jgi:hypothetical protein
MSERNRTIDQCIDALRKEWYRVNNNPDTSTDPRDIGLRVGMKSGLTTAMNILHTLYEDELSTHEKAIEFARKRNYHYTNTDNPIDFPKE